MRGQETSTSVFQSTPDPALTNFQVQPRSLAMFRAEAMVNLPGGLIFTGDMETGKIENGTNMEIHDAVLVDPATKTSKPLGTIAPNMIVKLDQPPAPGKAAEVSWTTVKPYLDILTEYSFERPEDAGEVRLVGWVADPHPGQVITPKVDRRRGFRLVIAHLRYGPPPDPAGPNYYVRSDVAK